MHKSILLLFFCFSAYAADFNPAILNVLNHEGFFVNDRSDPGGITNYGISLRYLRNLVKKSPEVQALFDIDGIPGVTAGDIAAMKIEDAIHVYRVFWWDNYNYAKIKNQSLANKIFDMSINMGSTESHLIVATSYQKLKNHLMKDLLDINLISASDSKRLLVIIREEQSYFYRTLAARYPKSKKFLNGWLKRAAE
jgi:hypothetical protein